MSTFRLPWRRLTEAERRLMEVERQLDSARRRQEEQERRLAELASYSSVKFNLKQLSHALAELHRKRYPAPQVGAAVHKELASKTCVQADFESDWFAFWTSEMKCLPTYHRKLWELCYIAQVLYAKGKLQHGNCGLGFGCGREPLPSLFAKYGTQVRATDQPLGGATSSDWMATGQHASSVDDIRRPDICPDPAMLANIQMEAVDMNAVPSTLHGRFDFCWSACALEHLGDIERGFRFIEESLLTLRPRGVAVHTTEFNFDDGETLQRGPTVLFQRRHFEALAANLGSKGYRVVPFDYSAGAGVLDNLIDVPPYPGDKSDIPLRGQEPPHLKILLGHFVCTSIGIVVEKLQ